nr:hypothetical protein [Trueperella pyogenes]
MIQRRVFAAGANEGFSASVSMRALIMGREASLAHGGMSPHIAGVRARTVWALPGATAAAGAAGESAS